MFTVDAGMSLSSADCSICKEEMVEDTTVYIMTIAIFE